VHLDGSDQLILEAAVLEYLPVVLAHQLEAGLEFTDPLAHRAVLLLHESDIFPLLVLLLELPLELQDLSLGVLDVFTVLGLELPQFGHQKCVLKLQI
jgi:hypothetical protein